MPGVTRRLLSFLALTVIFLLVMLMTSSSPEAQRWREPLDAAIRVRVGDQPATFVADKSVLSGPAIAPKLGNETAKAELGRAAWKLFHTVLGRFPESPTGDESEALRGYIHLFQRLYPCGECAEHFGKLLQKFPPQTSSRSTAALWGCHVHNEVNKRLKKPLFDCNNIGDVYKCGCADEEGASGKSDAEGGSKKELAALSSGVSV